jgi:hypothetical protein
MILPSFPPRSVTESETAATHAGKERIEIATAIATIATVPCITIAIPRKSYLFSFDAEIRNDLPCL